MKRKGLFPGSFMIIVCIALVSLIGCDNGTTPTEDNNDPKSVKIENITYIGRAGIFVFTDYTKIPDSNVAVNSNVIQNNTLTVHLTVPDSSRGPTYSSATPWTAEGEYYVSITPIVSNSYQSSQRRYYTNDGSPVKVNFDKPLVTLDFSKFLLSSEIQ